MARPTVGIDVDGGDSPEVTREAALLAAYEAKVCVVAYGSEAILRRTAKEKNRWYRQGWVTVVECPNHASAMRTIAKDLAQRRIDAWVTPTGSPRLLATLRRASLFMIDSCTPALMAPLPTKNVAGRGLSFLVDVGLTDEVHDPQVFVRWALWGARFLTNHFKIAEPRIGLYNIAVERAAPTIKRIHEGLLEASVPGYVGYAEPRVVVDGDVDLWLAEGLIGNGLIKVLESWLGQTHERQVQRFALMSKEAAKEATQATTEVFEEMLHGIALIAPVIGLRDDLLVCRTHGAATSKQIAGGIAAVQCYLQ